MDRPRRRSIAALAGSLVRTFRRRGILGAFSRLVALALALQLTPAIEVVENGVHVLAEGHGAHALDDAEHDPGTDCHGCSPTFHPCSCHAPIGVVLRACDLELVVTAPPAVVAPPLGEERAFPDHARGVFRPPIG